MRIAILQDDFDGKKGVVLEYDFETIKNIFIQEMGEKAGNALEKVVQKLKQKLLET